MTRVSNFGQINFELLKFFQTFLETLKRFGPILTIDLLNNSIVNTWKLQVASLIHPAPC